MSRITANGRRFHLYAVVISFLLIIAACGGSDPPSTQATTAGPATTAPSTSTPATTASPTTSEAPTTTAAHAPSQTAADAARDGVIAEVAALSMDLRVAIIDSVTTDEGVWAISRLSGRVDELADGCRLGPADGKYPTDFICTTEYGELLLLSQDRSRILRAYPLPGVPAEIITYSNDAIYCGRPGKLPMPDAMLCRVDRTSLDETIVVFPPGLDSLIVQPCFFPPDSWSVAAEPLDMNSLVIDDGVYTQAADGSWTMFNPATLALVGHNMDPPPGFGS